MINGSAQGGIWLQSDPSLRFGVSASTGGITELLRLSSTDPYRYATFHGGIDITGGGATMILRSRTGSGAEAHQYNSGGNLIFNFSGSGDRFWMNSNGDFIAGAALFPGGYGSCYLYRSSSDRLGVSQHLSVLGWVDAGNMTAAGHQVWSNGYHAPRIQGYCAYPSGNDWNNALDNGWYMGDGLANAPAAGWMKGMVTVHNTDWVEQEVHRFTDSGPCPNRWRRSRRNGTWTAWQRIPSVLVQSADPGGNAQDGDLWFW